MDQNIFLDISILLGITVSVAFLVRLLKQPLIAAYIAAGIVAGPLFLNLITTHNQAYSAFAELGVVLLLFIVGLELNIEYLKKIGATVATIGVIQVSTTTLGGIWMLHQLGFNFISSCFLALAITFSSTIIISKLLSEKKDTESLYGKYTLGLMLVQDVIAILIIIGISALGGSTNTLGSLQLLTLKGLGAFVVLFLLAKYVLPIIMDRVAGSGEFLFIFTITWCFGVANMMHALGFSPEIGAIAAGLTLGSSEYQREIVSRIKPLRDFFIILFFVILGSNLNLNHWQTLIWPSVLLSLYVLIVNPIILYVLFRGARFTRRNSFLVGINAAQVSEFGFILLFTGQSLGVLSNNELSIFTIVALVVIFCSSYLISFNHTLYHATLPFFAWFGKDRYVQHEQPVEIYDAWVFGYHRIGWKICEALRKDNVRFAVVDYNPETIARLRKRNIPAFFGDAADVEFLETLNLSLAKLVVLTIPDPDDQKTVIHAIRGETNKTLIIGSLYHTACLQELYAAGANYVMLTHLLGGQFISNILETEPWTKTTFSHMRQKQKAELK